MALVVVDGGETLCTPDLWVLVGVLDRAPWNDSGPSFVPDWALSAGKAVGSGKGTSSISFLSKVEILTH
jgi:hypothetical protein